MSEIQLLITCLIFKDVAFMKFKMQEIHTQSLESLFEQIDDEVPEFEYLLKTLRPYVVRVLHIREDSKLLNEVLDFIDAMVKSKPDSRCTWRQLYTITRILNGNVVVIEGSEIEETEAKSAPISDEIESKDTGLEEEERSLNSDEDSDETTEEDDRLTTDPGSPPPLDKQKDEIADEILAGFDNQTASDKTTDLNDDFLSELNNMTVEQNENIDSEDGDFLTELENFDAEYPK